MNIIKNRYWYFLISLLVIIPGLIFMILNWTNPAIKSPLPLGIDFTGGSLLEIQFTPAQARPTTAQVEQAFVKFAPNSDPVIQPLGDDSYSIRSKTIEDNIKGQIVSEIEKVSGGKVNTLAFTSVSASVGAEVARSAVVAILMAAVAILLYIWYAFRGVDHPLRYGTAAILAMLHDIFVVLGVEAMLAYFLGWEADALFLTALLTVIGFSVHDTIVVFDRIRENSHIYRRVGYEPLVNHSIVQTLDRSINTQLTVLLTLFALVLFGGESIRHFVTILLVGIFSGAYSSIFNASPVLVVWENQEWKNWFRRSATAES
ncbi:MAG TPA: protein translocase subunit SecF [Anaerolineales bacterium]|nr:protein translocase subunit SecF [Anaerolineales bacterium]